MMAADRMKFISFNSPWQVCIIWCYFTPGQLLSLPSEDTASGAHKPKIARTRFSIYQKIALENSFLSSLYLTGEERDVLAFKIGLSPGIVQVHIMLSCFRNWEKYLYPYVIAEYESK